MKEEKEHIESIFDYNPTERELRRFGIMSEEEMLKYGASKEEATIEAQIERQKKFFQEREKPEYYYLFLLFSMRGDKKRAAEYLAKAEPGQRDLLIQDC